MVYVYEMNQYTVQTEDELAQWVRSTCYHDVFASQGNAFTICMRLEAHRVRYEKNLFGKWVTGLFDSHVNPNLRMFSANSVMKYVPQGAIVTAETIIASDERKSPGTRTFATVIYELLIKIEVSKKIASELFNQSFGKEGYIFRDYLINERIDVISSLSDGIMETRLNKWCGLYTKLYVYKNGISNRDDDDYSKHRFFSKWELKDLDSIGKQYGLLLAILELYNPIWRQEGVLDIEYTFDAKQDAYVGVIVHAELPKKPALKLNEW